MLCEQFFYPSSPRVSPPSEFENQRLKIVRRHLEYYRTRSPPPSTHRRILVAYLFVRQAAYAPHVIGHCSGEHRASFWRPIFAYPSCATRHSPPGPDEPEERVLPAPETVFGIVTPPPFVRIATAPTGIPFPVYSGHKATFFRPPGSEVYQSSKARTMCQVAQTIGYVTPGIPRPPLAYVRLLLALRLPGPPLAAEASGTHTLRER